MLLETITNITMVSVGFGTAGLGSRCYEVVLEALAAGFRAFDTAEESDYWYNVQPKGRRRCPGGILCECNK
jgi:hypothetical protein